MSRTNPMPGGLNESPVAGTSVTKRSKRVKPSYITIPVDPAEPKNENMVGWGVDKPDDVQTRLQFCEHETSRKVSQTGMPIGQISRTVSAKNGQASHIVKSTDVKEGLD